MRVLIPQNIKEHWLWSDPIKFQWWLLFLNIVAEDDCVIRAKGEEFPCKRGQCITTQGKLAKLWGTTTPKAQAFLRKLEQMGEVRRNSDAKLTQITVCNLDDWTEPRRDVDAVLTHRRNSDAILTQTTDGTSDAYAEVRRNSDAILTQKETEKRKEKESFPPHPLYKEKENKKEKEQEANASMSSAPLDDVEANINFKKLVEYFNHMMDGKMIPSIKAILGKRRQAVLARSKEYGKESIMIAIQKAAESHYLNGGTKQGFVASFDWIFRPNNFPKVLEGNYDNEKFMTNGTTPRNITNSAEARQQRNAEFATHIVEKLTRGKVPGGSESD